MAANNVPCVRLLWPFEKTEPSIATMLRGCKFNLAINIPKNNKKKERKNDYLIRWTAIDFNIPLFTNVKVAKQFIDALKTQREKGFETKPWEKCR